MDSKSSDNVALRKADKTELLKVARERLSKKSPGETVKASKDVLEELRKLPWTERVKIYSSSYLFTILATVISLQVLVQFTLLQFELAPVMNLLITVIILTPTICLLLISLGTSAKELAEGTSGRLHELKGLAEDADRQLGEMKVTVDLGEALKETRSELAKSQLEATKALSEVEGLVKRAKETQVNVLLDGKAIKT